MKLSMGEKPVDPFDMNGNKKGIMTPQKKTGSDPVRRHITKLSKRLFYIGGKFLLDQAVGLAFTLIVFQRGLEKSEIGCNR